MREIKTSNDSVRLDAVPHSTPDGPQPQWSAEIYEYNGLRFGIDESWAHRDIALDDARALIAAWDRAQGALPELPPGYSVSPYSGDRFIMRTVDGLACLTAMRDEAIAAAWKYFGATIDPKWAQLLRNAGLPV